MFNWVKTAILMAAITALSVPTPAPFNTRSDTSRALGAMPRIR